MDKINQRQRIVNYLKDKKSATSIELVKDLNILRPSNRIAELRRDGTNIKVEIINSKNAYGNATRYARYTLEE